MKTQLILTADQHVRLQDHLLQDEQERVGFAFTEAVQHPDLLALETREVYLVPVEDLLFGEWGDVTLVDEAQAQIIKMAWDRRAALVEFHSHPDPRYRAQFSPFDLRGFEEFVPHVRWRLKGQPYAALVWAPDGFDGLVWRDQVPEAQELDAIMVGSQLHRPTGLTITELRRRDGSQAI